MVTQKDLAVQANTTEDRVAHCVGDGDVSGGVKRMSSQDEACVVLGGNGTFRSPRHV